MYELFFNFVIYSFLGNRYTYSRGGGRWKICKQRLFERTGLPDLRVWSNYRLCGLKPNQGQPIRSIYRLGDPDLGARACHGFVLEKLFHQRWWDYTDEKFNIGGYICLEFSLLWGMACIIVVDVVQSMTIDLINFIPRRAGVVALWIIGILFVADLIVTVIGINNLNRRMKPIAAAAWRLNRLSNKIGGNLSGATIKTINHAIEFKEKNDRRLERLESKIDEMKSAPIFDKDEFAEELRKRRKSLERNITAYQISKV